MARASFKKYYRKKRKKSFFKSRFFLTFILLSGLFTALFYFFIFSDFFWVEKNVITGAKRAPSQQIDNILKENAENKLIFFESRSIFLFNKTKAKKEILSAFPEIEDLKIEKKLPRTIKVSLKEREKEGVFCFEKKCFLLDQEGIAFYPLEEESPKNASDKSIVVFENELFKKEPVLGEKVIEDFFMGPALTIKSFFEKELNIPLKRIIIASRARLNFETREGWRAYFSLEKDIEWQKKELFFVLKKRVLPEKRKNLEYIDLRFDKIFISPKDYNL